VLKQKFHQMDKIFLTSLTTDEVRQMFRYELELFFADRAALQGRAGNEEEILTIQEAAEFLSLTVPTLYSKVSKGELPFWKRDKRLYFSKSELMNWVKSGRQKTNAEIESEAGSCLKKKGVGHD
jgi:excisionase family DNA binding protein